MRASIWERSKGEGGVLEVWTTLLFVDKDE